MTVNRTTLLDLPLPVTGTESGTWGDTTNNGLSQYMDIAIAGMNSLTSANFTAGALTLANTLGDSSATNIAAGSAQYATIRVSSLAVNSTITAPGSNRSYRIINADATYSLTIKASGQTGVTFLPGQTGVVAFNSTDYVIVGVVGAGTATDNAVARFDGTTGKLVQNSVVTIADSTGDISGVGQLNATTLDATNIEVTNIKAKDGTAAGSIADSTGVVSFTANPVMSGGTTNGVLYLNGSKVLTTGSALVFNGTNLGLGVTPSAWSTLRGFQVGQGASLAGHTTLPITYLGANFFFDGTNNKYITSNYASRFIADGNSGSFAWQTAPSGTAGNAITFTQAMTLDASGNLGVGTTSPNFTAAGRGNINVNGSSDAIIALSKGLSSTTAAYFYFDGTDAEIRNINNGALKLSTNNTERARITSGGKFLVGQTALNINANNIAEFQGSCGIGLRSVGGAAFSGLQVWNDAASGDNLLVEFLTDAGGVVRGTIDYNRAGGLVRYNTTSDYRAKDIIGPVQNPGAVIDALKVYEGRMKGATQSRPMLIAHEAQEVAPYAVTGEKDAVNKDGTPKYQQMDVSSLVPLLLAEIQSLRQRVALLEGN